MNHLDAFKAKADRGDLCVGMVVTLSDPVVSELAGDVGYDFTWIDMEHAPLGIETVQGHIMATRGTGCAPFVRVVCNDRDVLKPVLDLAPAAVIIPRVNTAEAAAEAVAACKYPPYGCRGCGAIAPPAGPGGAGCARCMPAGCAAGRRNSCRPTGC